MAEAAAAVSTEEEQKKQKRDGVQFAWMCTMVLDFRLLDTLLTS
jgi:hypothetical protein